MRVRVNIEELQKQSRYSKALGIALGEKVLQIHGLYNSLDDKIKNRQDIGNTMLSLRRRLELAEEKMYNISEFLSTTAEVYNNAENAIALKAGSLGVKYKFKDINNKNDILKSFNNIKAFETGVIENKGKSKSRSKHINYKDVVKFVVGKAKTGITAIKDENIVKLLKQTESFAVGNMESLTKNLVVEPIIDTITVMGYVGEKSRLAKKGTAFEAREDLIQREKVIDKFIGKHLVLDKKAYGAGKVSGDIEGTVIGITGMVKGIPEIIIGTAGVGLGVATSETGIGLLAFGGTGAVLASAGAVQTAYGGDVIGHSVYNLKEDLASFMEGTGKIESNISRIKEIEVDFNYNSKYDEGEFARQLADQEAGMNKLTVDEYLKNRERYIAEGRSIEGNMTQQATRDKALADKIDELRSTGMSLKEAETQAQSWLDTQAALHNPDQIAGGNPLNIGGMGDKQINSSIGSQWKYRIDAVDEQIQAEAKNMTDAERQSTYLNVKLKY